MQHHLELFILFVALACTVYVLPGRSSSTSDIQPEPRHGNSPITAANSVAVIRGAPESALVPGLDVRFRLTKREGPPPDVSPSPPGTNIAHSQLTQQAPPSMQEALFAGAAGLPDIHVAPSGISVPGARAFLLDPAVAEGPGDAFQIGTEFAHIHPAYDGSLHVKLPPAVANVVFRQGWGVPHPRSGTPLLFGPRTQEELEIVWQVVLRSYEWARSGRIVSL